MLELLIYIVLCVISVIQIIIVFLTVYILQTRKKRNNGYVKNKSLSQKKLLENILEQQKMSKSILLRIYGILDRKNND